MDDFIIDYLSIFYVYGNCCNNNLTFRKPKKNSSPRHLASRHFTRALTFWLIPIFALLALGGGALSDPIWTGIFWCLLGIAMAAGGIRAAPPLGVGIVGLAWFLWTCLAFLPIPLDLMGTSGISPRSGFLTPLS